VRIMLPADACVAGRAFSTLHAHEHSTGREPQPRTQEEVEE
jgi:hypothetical protein